MKKYLIILFIFLTGFIFAGANASNCDVSPAEILKIQGAANLSGNNVFLDYENNIIKENLKSLKSNQQQENSGSFNPETTLSFENNNKYIKFEKQYTLINSGITEQQLKDIKFKLYPRAP